MHGRDALWRRCIGVALLGCCLALGVGCSRPAARSGPSSPAPTATEDQVPPSAAVAVTMIPLSLASPVLRAPHDETITSNYYWVHDGERIDRRPTLSPDGRWVAWIPYTFADGIQSYRLLIRDTATGEVRDLTIDPAIQISSPRWSPDSQSLAFVAYRRTAGRAAPSAVWRVAVDTGARLLLYRDENARGAPDASGPSLSLGAWSPDGARLAVGGTIWGGPSPGGSQAGVWLDTDGSATLTPIPRLTGVECGTSRAMPNQYRAPGDDYVICQVGTADLLRVPDTPPARPTDQALVLHDRGTGQNRVLLSHPGGAYLVGFSPDGAWIIFATGSYPEGHSGARFGVIRCDGTGRYDFEATGVFPLPDGRLYFVAPTTRGDAGYTLSILDLATHDSRPVIADWPDPAILASSFDGGHILAIRSASDAPRVGVWRDGEIHLYTLATGTAPR